MAAIERTEYPVQYTTIDTLDDDIRSYSAVIYWTMRMLGMSDRDGAGSITFVEDSIISYTPWHLTWVRLFYFRCGRFYVV